MGRSVIGVVTAKTQYNLKNAKGYFEEHLCVGDYYDEGQRISGAWFGAGAERLGLNGKVRADEFLRLCDNQHPSTGEKLTQRFKTTRQDGDHTAANRRIFYDFTFSPPKSVSLAALVGNDEKILESHLRAVRLALKEFETVAATRVRAGKAESDRITKNFAAALFTHDTSRALDPHLHTHCIVFNATFDAVENRWKALQNHELLRAKKFVENAYYHELARELRSFGYIIRNRARGDFQIEGVSEELCKRFSKRHQEIDQSLAKLLEEKPELATGDLMAARRLLATSERARKRQNQSRAELRTLWESQLTREEKAALGSLCKRTNQCSSDKNQVSLWEAVQWAEEHLFDRNSVVMECQLWQEALGRARGGDFGISELKEFTNERGYIRDKERAREVTLRDVLLREWEIVQTAKEGVASCHPLVANPSPANPILDEEQQRALAALLASTNTVSIFRGGAGTGKSFVLRELVKQVAHSGRDVVVLAPQRQQVVEMENAGFDSPATIASFLLKRELSENAVVVVDEAGQIGGRQMVELVRIVRQRNARLVLSGDTRQHGAVEASDALRAIEGYSGVKPVELHKIRRQDPSLGRDDGERAQIEQYRKAVDSAASGKFQESFERLEKMGAVVSTSLGDQAGRLADEYVRLVEQNASAVVVSQTWDEVHHVNSRVRDALKGKGLLGAHDTMVQALDKLDLTDAQKRDERFYPEAAVIVFNQKIRGAEPGAKGKLAGILKSSVLVEVGGEFITVANKLLSHVTIYQPRELPIAQGDRLHLKTNRKLVRGGRVTNGEIVTVKSVKPNGEVELSDGRVLDKNIREFLPGYAVTSYGSQGKTVDYVLFSDSTVKSATNAQQWYVTISRGRRGVRIFTPHKEQLRENLSRSGHRPLALEFTAGLFGRCDGRLWNRLNLHLLRFGRSAAETLSRLRLLRRHSQNRHKNEHKNSRMLGERAAGARVTH